MLLDNTTLLGCLAHVKDGFRKVVRDSVLIEDLTEGPERVLVLR